MEWSEVVEHLRGQYNVGHVTGSWLELWWSFREGDRGIRQHQTVRTIECHGERYYVVEAEVAVPVRARVGLRRGAQLAIGTLSEDNGPLVARTQIPASALTPGTLDRLLYAIAHGAMHLSLSVWERQQAAAKAEAAADQQSQPPASTRLPS